MLSVFFEGVFLVASLFILKVKGIKIAGNIFSIGAVLILLGTINILNPDISVMYKYLQGFYTVFAVLILGVLFASKFVLIFNTIIVIASTTRVYFFAVNQIPEKRDLLLTGYIANAVSLILVTIILYFAVRFAEIAINAVKKDAKIKDKQNKELEKAGLF